tara:strand:+ start:413 stop:847 length:435 start_codon:yes stop_codon:yes gene_type:complete
MKGMIITHLKEIQDDRGSILHMLRADEKDFDTFGECYFSEINPGKVKAWKCHSRQSQNISVPVGKIRLVLFDERSNSSTKNKLQILELGRPDNYKRVHIPKGIWYGFKCLSNMPAIIANCADIPHEREESEIRPPNHSKIPYQF